MVSESASSVVHVDMLLRLLTDQLSEYSYNATLAGTHAHDDT